MKKKILTEDGHEHIFIDTIYKGVKYCTFCQTHLRLDYEFEDKKNEGYIALTTTFIVNLLYNIVLAAVDAYPSRFFLVSFFVGVAISGMIWMICYSIMAYKKTKVWKPIKIKEY